MVFYYKFIKLLLLLSLVYIINLIYSMVPCQLYFTLPCRRLGLVELTLYLVD